MPLCGGDKSTQWRDIRNALVLAGEVRSAMETIRFDASLYLASDEAQVELIAEAIATGHAGFIARAIEVVARARGVTVDKPEPAENATSPASDAASDPQLQLFFRVLADLGLELKLQATG